MKTINPEAVKDAYAKCVLQSNEITDMTVKKVEVRTAFGNLRSLHVARLEAFRPCVKEWLEQLPKDFHEPGGGLFTSATQYASGRVWGSSYAAGALLTLGLALDLCEYPIPYGRWHLLGGQPLVRVKADDVVVEEEGWYYIDFNTEEEPEVVQAVRVKIELERVTDLKRELPVNLCDHPLYSELQTYVLENPISQEEAE